MKLSGSLWLEEATVTPAKAGVQNYLILLDSRLRWNDNLRRNPTFYEIINYEFYF
jgi:hypothetical protein